MDDQLKQQLMVAVVVFNLTLVTYVLVRYFLGARGFFGDFMVHVLVGAGIGLVTGGIAFFLSMRKK